MTKDPSLCKTSQPGSRYAIGRLRQKDAKNSEIKRHSHRHRGFADDEAGPEPDRPGKPPRGRGDGNPSTRRWGASRPLLGTWGAAVPAPQGCPLTERPRPA